MLASGSAGNCALVEAGPCRVLIDCGLSARQVALRLAQLGIDASLLDGIVLTHEHADHTSGLEVFCRRHAVPLYANGLTAETLRRGRLADYSRWKIFETGADFAIGDLRISSFPVPHDAVDPVGLTFHHADRGLGFLTDLGCAPRLVLDRLRAVQTLVIETNHDERLLMDDPRRPWPVKQRILSRHGHLSNAAAAEVVAGLAGGALGRVVLGHLSRDCNRPELALGVVGARLRDASAAGIDLVCASQDEVSRRFPVGAPW